MGNNSKKKKEKKKKCCKSGCGKKCIKKNLE